MFELTEIEFQSNIDEIESVASVTECSFYDLDEWSEVFNIWLGDGDKKKCVEILLESKSYSGPQDVIDATCNMIFLCDNHGFDHEVEGFVVSKLQEEFEVDLELSEYVDWCHFAQDRIDQDYNVVKGENYTMLLED